ncbi:MAG TPA: tetratricopeptide repeat protein [Candidatus Limnocylindrales bacterium]|nr:tetratricopeptide repeat protein [Candidatus Limnocylindrales bacterium]
MASTERTASVLNASSKLGERVRAARRELGMSQSQLAGEELTKGFISQLEAGLVRPSIRSLQVIATRLGKSLDYFLGDEPLATAKRLAFHRLAAEAAVERADWAEVRRHVASALEQTPEPRERGRLLVALASAELGEGQREAAFDRVNEAQGLLDIASDPAEVATLHMLRGRAYAEIGQLVAATEAYETARDTMDRYEVTEPRLRARLLVALGTIYRRLNRTAKAMTTYEKALSFASRTSELRTAARGYMGIAVTLYDSGELDAAIGNYRRALELFERVSDASFELNVLQSLAAIQFEQGDVATARDAASRALRRAVEVGDAHWAAVAETVLARVSLAEGGHDEALRLAQHAERVLLDSGDDLQRADALRVVGASHEARGDAAAADEAYRRSIEVLTAIEDKADLSAVAAEYAQKLRARGDLEAAFEMLELARGSAAKR